MVFIIGSAIVLVTMASWSLYGQTGVSDAPTAGSCHNNLGHQTSIRMAAAWEALLAYDCIIFCLTVFKTWTARPVHTTTGVNIPLITLLLRDGSLYFAVLALCNFSNILTFHFAGPFLRGSLSMFASCLSLTLICRLMLNLHRTADSGIYTTDQIPTQGICFTSGLYMDTIHPMGSIWDIETAGQDHQYRADEDSKAGL